VLAEDGSGVRRRIKHVALNPGVNNRIKGALPAPPAKGRIVLVFVGTSDGLPVTAEHVVTDTFGVDAPPPSATPTTRPLVPGTPPGATPTTQPGTPPSEEAPGEEPPAEEPTEEPPSEAPSEEPEPTEAPPPSRVPPGTAPSTPPQAEPPKDDARPPIPVKKK